MSDSVWKCGRSLVLWVPGISGLIGNGILGEYFSEREYNLLNPKRTRKRPKFQPWPWPTMSKTGTLHLISGLNRDFPNFIFWPILTLQQVFKGHFSRSLRKFDLNTCFAALNPDFFFGLTFFTWWPEMTLTCIMVTKHRKWYLQMSVTLSMPIHWFCLRLTPKFYSPMSPSPKSRKFLLWLDLWRHQWHPG